MKNDETSIIIQTCVPDYRKRIFQYLINHGFSIFSGKEYYTKSVKPAQWNQVNWINNTFYFRRRVLFQSLPFWKILRAKDVIIEFNPRNLSLYLVLISRLLSGKKTYLWGHAWARQGKKSKSEPLRLFLKRLSSGIIAYTASQKKELEKQLKNKPIYCATNSIYHDEELHPKLVKEESSINSIIYVGRLVSEKKILFAVESFAKNLESLPESMKFHIVGDGSEKPKIQELIENHGLKNRVKLFGHISDLEELRDLYSRSFVSISPGYVGLSITQSLGFGVPMLISRDEAHSPELEAAEEGVNSYFFETDNPRSFIERINEFWDNKEAWLKKRNQISQNCREKYSIEKMAEPFLEIINNT